MCDYCVRGTSSVASSVIVNAILVEECRLDIMNTTFVRTELRKLSDIDFVLR